MPSVHSGFWESRAILALRHRVWPVLAPAGIIWADESLRHLRRVLRSDGIDARLPSPPRAGAWLSGLIARWLNWRGATCLERSLILQRWLLELGRPHDLLIGVQGSGSGDGAFAHAWLDHEDSMGYAELLRVHPSRNGTTIPRGLGTRSWR
jgi:hypothetical protein